MLERYLNTPQGFHRDILAVRWRYRVFSLVGALDLEAAPEYQALRRKKKPDMRWCGKECQLVRTEMMPSSALTNQISRAPLKLLSSGLYTLYVPGLNYRNPHTIPLKHLPGIIFFCSPMLVISYEFVKKHRCVVIPVLAILQSPASTQLNRPHTLT